VKYITLLALVTLVAYAQDTRHVTEPVIPSACATLTAQLSVEGNKITDAQESQLDTARIQKAMDTCPKGNAVVLKPSAPNNAFLTGPLQLRAGVTLVVDGGATLFASRDPRLYDITPGVCGTITPKGHGCRAMINGDGVAGHGPEHHLVGPRRAGPQRRQSKQPAHHDPQPLRRLHPLSHHPQGFAQLPRLL
jgi:polygalacturonase